MMVEMLVRRVVGGKVIISVEMVDTRGDTECVTRIRSLVRRTALAAESSSQRCTSLSITGAQSAVEGVSFPRRRGIAS